MRYTYLGDKLTSPKLIGMICNPILDERGKCIISQKMASALVEDEQGNRYVVMRRKLRLNHKVSEE